MNPGKSNVIGFSYNKTTFKIITVLFILSQSVMSVFSQNFQWAKGMGGSADEEGKDIVVDHSGNVYTCGIFKDTVDFDGGSGTYNLTSAGDYDIFISKVDPSGNFMWTKRIGAGREDGANAIIIDPSGKLNILGYFRDTVDFDPGSGNYPLIANGWSEALFILKLDPAGSFLSALKMNATTFNYGSISGTTLAIDDAGSLFLAGSFSGSVDFDPGTNVSNMNSNGSRDIFAAKLDSSGTLVWAKKMGGKQSDYAFSIALDNVGNSYLAGIFQDTADFDPDAGVYNLIAYGQQTQSDIVVIKLSASGNLVWAKQMGGVMSDYGKTIALDAQGNVYTSGEFRSSYNNDFDPGPGVFPLPILDGWGFSGFISKLDSAGNFIWAKLIKGYGDLATTDLAVDPAGNIYTCGNFEVTDFDPGAGTFQVNSVNNDSYILLLDSGGNFIWVKTIVGTSHNGANAIYLSDSGNIYTTGYFYATADFNPDSSVYNLVAAGRKDIYISKLDACKRPAAAGTITGLTNVCQHTSAIFTLTAVNGASGYSWTLPAGAVLDSGLNSNTVKITFGTVSGIIKVSAINQCGSGMPANLAITLKPAPSLNSSVLPSATVCAGTRVTFNGSGATTLSWSGGIMNGVPFTATSSGGYVLTGIGANGCIATRIQSIYVNPPPVISRQPLNQSAHIGVDAYFNIGTITSGASFQWQQNNGTGFLNLSTFGQFSGVTNDTLMIASVNSTQNNFAYRCIIKEGNCSDTSNIALLNISTTGLQKAIDEKTMLIYPNPARDQLIIHLTALAVKPAFFICNLNGVEVLQGTLNNEINRIEIDALSSGVYFVYVQGLSNSYYKFVKY